MSTPWETEEEEPTGAVPTDAEIMLQRDVAVSFTARQLGTLGKQKVKPEYKTKAYLVLVDSDKHDWGIVEDTLNDLAWEPGKGEIVGTWSRTKYDSLIHISLATSLAALQDRSIQTFAHYAEERRLKAEGAKRAPRRQKKAEEPTQVQEQAQELSIDEKMRFNSLRARLGRVR